MPKNYFRENRKKVQRSFLNSDLLKPLTKETLPFSIIEKKVKAGEGKLRVVNIDEVPVTDSIRPISYVFDTEFEGKVFNKAENQKRVEKILLILTATTLHVVMVEMKTTLQTTTFDHIQGKIRDSLTRLSLFLPNYIFEVDTFNEYSIKYHCVVFYNKGLSQADIDSDPGIASNDLVKIFQGKQPSFFSTEHLGETCKVFVHFKQNNSDNLEELDVNLGDFFEDDIEFANAIYSDTTLPEEI